jgi:hypothetical protein
MGLIVLNSVPIFTHVPTIIQLIGLQLVVEDREVIQGLKEELLEMSPEGRSFIFKGRRPLT